MRFAKKPSSPDRVYMWAAGLVLIMLSVAPAGWTSSLSVLPEAASRGDRGMRVLLDETRPGYVQDDSPGAKVRYRARFYVRVDELVLTAGDSVTVLAGYDLADALQFAVRIKREGTQIRLSYAATNDGGGLVEADSSGEVTLADGWHIVEIDWSRGAGSGYLHVWCDLTLLSGLSGLNNGGGQIDYVRLGAVEGPGTPNAGYFDLDDFVARQTDYIGAPPDVFGIANVRVNVNAADTVIPLTGVFNDPENGPLSLTYTLSGNTNSELFTAAIMDSPARTLTLDYAPDTTGTAILTVRATDLDALYSDASFTVTVNGPPTTTGIGNVEVLTDAPDTVISLFDSFSDVEDPDTALIYTITNNTDPSLFDTITIDQVAGTLTLDYWVYAPGEATLTVRATDTDGLYVETSFTVTITVEILEFYTADTDLDHEISLSELLRVIQFYNSEGFSCAVPPDSTEDGFLPNTSGTTDCRPYAADYNPQNWRISLSELLRVIQFYNSGGYYACPDEEPPTEDGYCAGPP